MNKGKRIVLKFGNGGVILHFEFFQRVAALFINFINKTMHQGVIIFTKRNITGTVSGICSVLIMHFIIGWTVENSFFLTLAIVFYLMRWDSRIIIMGALLSLISIMIMTFLYDYGITEKEWAEKVAVWAYFFLVIGVFGQIIELYFEKQINKE